MENIYWKQCVHAFRIHVYMSTETIVVILTPSKYNECLTQAIFARELFRAGTL